MKLLSYLQQTLQLSRRGFTALVDQGKIFCNSTKVESYGFLVEEGDLLDIDQKRLVVKSYAPVSQLISFYKPAGYVVSKSDPHNQTIYTILPQEFSGYYYVGRLDKDSRGLLLLTNDSALVDRYEHPRNGIQKKYLVIINKLLHLEDAQKCLDGVFEADELLRMISIKNVSFADYPSEYFPHNVQGFLVEVVLEEGKKRHIRRMFSALRYHVLDLLRTHEGIYDLSGLREGEWKLLD